MSLWSKLTGRRPKPKHTDDPPEVIQQNLAEGYAIMLDVRSQKERDAGHLKDSIFIPIDEIKALPKGLSELPKLDKDKIIYCH